MRKETKREESRLIIIMVEREKKQKRDILESKRICCCPAENQAAKFYAEFMNNHPEYTMKDVDMYIHSVEREEDYYGNGGGWEHTCIIYKTREETDKEQNKRVKEEVEEVMTTFEEKLLHEIKDFFKEMYGYNFICEDDDETLTKKSREFLLSLLEDNFKKH